MTWARLKAAVAVPMTADAGAERAGQGSLRVRPVLLRLLFAAAALAAVQVAFPVAAQQVQLQSRVFEIAGQLRCPVCVSESVADSNAQLAQQMRQLIQQQLEEGRSEAEIFAYFTNRYGDWIMLDPPKRGVHLLVWLLPVVAVVIGVATLGFAVRRWLARSRERPQVDQDELERVRAELRASDS